jgi:predicted anti-sigma-YlaC factor YlaD
MNLNRRLKSISNKTLVLSALVALAVLQLFGCSLKRITVNSLANALTENSTSVFATDDDPDLVMEAMPFALKTMEALLQSSPKNKKLLIGTAAAFVQYSHAFVLFQANALEQSNLNEARKGRLRAKRLFLRARDYGLRALELSYPDISNSVVKDPFNVVRLTKKEDVPALYWTAVAWGSAISVAKDDMALVGDLPVVTAFLERALELDESWQNGTIHEVFIVFDAGRTQAEGGGVQKAEAHFERAMELNKGRSIRPFVSLAESVCVKQQNRARFELLLKQVLEFDVERYPEYRLSNIIAQQKARQLLENIDNLFI